MELKADNEENLIKAEIHNYFSLYEFGSFLTREIKIVRKFKNKNSKLLLVQTY